MRVKGSFSWCSFVFGAVLVLGGCGETATSTPSTTPDVPSDNSNNTPVNDNNPNPPGDSTPVPDCNSVEVTFGMEGSQLDIRNTPLGAGDGTQDIGPGTLVLRLPADSAGNLIDGPVTLVSYNMAVEFTIADVETDLDAEAVPEDDCGVAQGSIENGSLTWDTAVLDYRQYGTITCRGSQLICGLAGFEKDVPEERDSTHDQDFNSFVFGEGPQFEMDWVEIPNEDAGDSFLRLVGAEASRGTCEVAPVCTIE